METTRNTQERKKTYRWALFVGTSLMIVFGIILLFADTSPANQGPAVLLSIRHLPHYSRPGGTRLPPVVHPQKICPHRIIPAHCSGPSYQLHRHPLDRLPFAGHNNLLRRPHTPGLLLLPRAAQRDFHPNPYSVHLCCIWGSPRFQLDGLHLAPRHTDDNKHHRFCHGGLFSGPQLWHNMVHPAPCRVELDHHCPHPRRFPTCRKPPSENRLLSGGKEEQQANNLLPPAKPPSHRPHRSACNTERI